MQKLFYLTQDPYYGGGIGAMNAFFEQYLRKRNKSASQVFIAHQQALSLKKLLTFKWRVEHIVDGDVFQRVLLGSFPYLEPFAFVLPKRYLQRLIKQHQQFIAVLGYASAAHILAESNVPYVLWIATTVGSEKKSQSVGFTRWRDNLVFRLNRLLMGMSQTQELQALSNATKVYAISSTTKKEILKLGIGEDQIEILPPPVDTQYFTPGLASPEERDKIIFNVGRLDDPRKNVPLLLDAFAQFRQSHPEFRLVLGGQPGLTERAISDRQLNGFVDLLGPISESDKRKWLQRSYLYVLTSVQEGFGIVLVEAMACGLPVISTRSGGPEDVIRHGETGELVDSIPQAIAANMSRLVEDRDLWQRYHQAGLSRVSDRFSYNVVEKRFDTILK